MAFTAETQPYGRLFVPFAFPPKAGFGLLKAADLGKLVGASNSICYEVGIDLQPSDIRVIDFTLPPGFGGFIGLSFPEHLVDYEKESGERRNPMKRIASPCS